MLLEFIHSEVFGYKIIHFLPLAVFGPFLLTVFYNLILRDMVNPTPEIRELRLRQKEERRRLREERKIEAIVRKKSGIGGAGIKITPVHLFFQALFFVPFAIVLGIFSAYPSYTVIGTDKALIKLSMTLPGKHKVECRKRTREEIAKLPPNMRAPMSCSRERWPVLAELKVDGERYYREAVDPIGLSKDGQSSFYQKFSVPAGAHTVFLGIRDRGENEEFNYILEKKVSLDPAEVLVITFNTVDGTIYTK